MTPADQDMSNQEPTIDPWRRELDALVTALARERTARGLAAEFHTVVVVDEVDSTQELARARGATTGEIIAARRQTAGRGRFGRSWADTAHEGVALSLVVHALPPEQLMMRSAVAVAAALEALGSLRFGIKWPNDVLAPDGGKVAGILIERVGDAAIIGIGVNVRQRAFPEEIARRARSLAMLGLDVDRLDVLTALVTGVDTWLAAPADRVVEAYRRRDVLVGTHARFTCGGRVIEGRVIEVDPIQGIRVAASSGEETLSAAIATVVVDSDAVTTT